MRYNLVEYTLEVFLLLLFDSKMLWYSQHFFFWYPMKRYKVVKICVLLKKRVSEYNPIKMCVPFQSMMVLHMPKVKIKSIILSTSIKLIKICCWANYSLYTHTHIVSFLSFVEELENRKTTWKAEKYSGYSRMLSVVIRLSKCITGYGFRPLPRIGGIPNAMCPKIENGP